MIDKKEFLAGWPELITAMVCVGVGVSMLPFYTSGVFIPAWENQFGWERTVISTGNLVFMGGIAIASPFIGSLIDRYGLRLVALVSMLAVAAGFTTQSFNPGSQTYFLVVMFLTGLFGAGTSTVVFTRPVVDVFIRSRGLALGLTIGGGALASVWGPPVAGTMIEKFSIQGGYLTLAVVALATIPLILRMSSERNGSNGQEAASASFTERMTLIANRRFVVLTIAAIAIVLAATGGVVHLVPMLTDRGMTVAEAASIAGVMGISILISRFVIGLALDNFHPPLVAALAMGLAGSGALLLSSDIAGSEVIGALLIGLAMGAEIDILAFFVSRYYRTEDYTSVFGSVYSVVILSAGAGPVLLSMTRDMSGDYGIGLLGVAALLIGSAPLFFLIHLWRDRSLDESPHHEPTTNTEEVVL